MRHHAIAENNSCRDVKSHVRLLAIFLLYVKIKRGKVKEYFMNESLTYGTEDLTKLPSTLESTVRKTHLSKIGIGLVFKKNPGNQMGTFYISLLFD